MREGLGSEEEDLRPDLYDFAVVVVPREDLAPIEFPEPNLKASSEGLSLTMTEVIPNESPVVLTVRGYEEVLGLSLTSDALYDGVGSVMLVADLPELPSAAPLLLMGVVLEVPGCTAMMGLSPSVSAHSIADGGQAMGDGVDGEITGGLGESLLAFSVVDSDIPVQLVGYISPSLLADIDGGIATLLSVCGDAIAAGEMVSEEGLISSAAREALRPPHTDGRGQPPLLPVEPAMVAGRDGSLPAVGGGLPSEGGGLDTVGRMGGDATGGISTGSTLSARDD
ncbi:hypothetical protein Dimus_013501 [Dionaea muscipula]